MINKEIIAEDTFDEYKLVAKSSSDSDQVVLRIIHQNAGKHFAEHKFVHVFDESNNLIGAENINKENIPFVIKSIKKRGITEGLHVTKKDNHYIDSSLNDLIIEPEAVRHSKTNSESSFTSTGEKLDAHWPIFNKFQKTGFGSIIRATMTLHQVCMSRCQFCSTIGRNKKDRINLDEAKHFINSLYDDQAIHNITNFPDYNKEYKKITNSDIRLKGLILSGGGQPNLWPHFEDFVQWLSEKDISLGLITNGFPKNISESIYDKFDWIRLSITPEDASSFYPDAKFNLQYIPQNIIDNENVTFGMSYVYGPWTDNDILNRIKKASEIWNCEYVRVLTDCNLSRNLQLKSHCDLSDKLLELGYIDKNGNPLTKIFHQLKYHGTKEEANYIWDEGQCYLQLFNTFWDTTGHEENGHSYCYPCDSVTVLAEGEQENDYSVENIHSERKFNYSKWGTYKNTEVSKLFTEKVKSFFDPKKNCAACLFQNNNKKVKQLINLKDYNSIKINKDIKHINFP